ncbi:MAG TPA: hypothetical protein VIF12_04740, partial [Micavibrio sp.]
GAGSQILGAISIGDGARVGANSVVTKNVPANVSVMGIPARVICAAEKDFCAYGMPDSADNDPLAEVINGLLRDVERLKGGMPSIVPERTTPDEDYARRWEGSGI